MIRPQAMLLVGILAAGCASDGEAEPECPEFEASAAAAWEDISELQANIAEWQANGCGELP